jgi:hypothetical protein
MARGQARCDAIARPPTCQAEMPDALDLRHEFGKPAMHDDCFRR